MSSELCPHLERTPRGWLLLWGVWVYIHLRIHTPVNPRGPSTHVTLNSWLEAGSLGHGGRVTGRLPGIASCQGAPHPPRFRGTLRMPGFCTCIFVLCTEMSPVPRAGKQDVSLPPARSPGALPGPRCPAATWGSSCLHLSAALPALSLLGRPRVWESGPAL